MKGYIGVVFLSLLALTMFHPGVWEPSYSWAVDLKFLADRHSVKGIRCEGCHKEDPPQAASMKVCMACHGEYKEIAAKTKDVEPNPHASHEGSLECGACHQGHKPGKDFCAQCHSFDFKVR